MADRLSPAITASALGAGADSSVSVRSAPMSQDLTAFDAFAHEIAVCEPEHICDPELSRSPQERAVEDASDASIGRDRWSKNESEVFAAWRQRQTAFDAYKTASLKEEFEYDEMCAAAPIEIPDVIKCERRLDDHARQRDGNWVYILSPEKLRKMIVDADPFLRMHRGMWEDARSLREWALERLPVSQAFFEADKERSSKTELAQQCRTAAGDELDRTDAILLDAQAASVGDLNLQCQVFRRLLDEGAGVPPQYVEALLSSVANIVAADRLED